MKWLNNIILWNDAPEPWQVSFQDSVTRSMEGIDRLNGFIYYYEIILLVLIGWLFISIFLKYTGELISYKYNNHGATLEIIWTCSPALILMSIAFPSFRLIYLTDEITESDITIKVIGFLLGGLTLYILNKIKDTYDKNQVVPCLLSIGEKNNISNNCLIESFFTFFNIPNIRANKRIGPHNKQNILLRNSNITQNSKNLISTIYNTLNPYYITGFSDGESSFKISIYKKKECKTGWWVIPTFTIEVHQKDENLLTEIRDNFGVGSINIRKRDNQIIYTVGKVKDLIEVIIPHFDKYPLLTQKQADYLLFKKAVELINNKEHLTIDGLNKIINIRASINKGLTKILKESFTNINPIKRPECNTEIKIISPFWITGFVEGEGCFMISIKKSKSYKIGYQTQLKFIITQHNRDIKLLNNFINYFNCGKIYERSKSVNFIIFKMIDLENKVIPFFNKYSLQGNKNLEFKDFSKVITLMKTKEHLTELGLQQIVNIKDGMNRGRYINRFTKNTTGLHKCKTKKDIFGIQKRFFHKNIKGNKRIGPHNQQVISIIIGSLLGKTISKKFPEGIRLYFKQNIFNKDYIFWLNEFFYNNGYCTNLLPRKYTRKLKKNNEIKEYFGYEFNTFSFRSLNWIHKMFYRNGKKRIKMDLLEKYLDPLTLAIWIMDDGGFTKYGVRIATNCFTLEEVEFLKDLLKKKFNLNCTVQKIQTKGQWSLYIKAESMKNLRDLVLPYIHSSMLYKIGLKNKD